MTAPGQDRAVGPLVTGAADASAYRALLSNRNYRNFFVSAFASSLGDWTGFFALQTLVTSLNPAGSRTTLFALGGVMMARLLPSLLIGPVAGVLADRYDRKRLMVSTDLLRGGLFVGVALSTDIVTLFVLTFAVECFALLFISAKDASLPTIVDQRHLPQANQLNLLVSYGTLPLGAVVATAMIPVAAVIRDLGVESLSASRLALLADAATFFVAAALLSRLRLPARSDARDREERPGVVAELREGLAFINGLPLVRSLILGVVGVFFGAGVVVTLGPVFVQTSLGRPEQDWFTLATFVGGGLVVGIAASPLVTRRFRQEKVFPVALAATGAIAVVMAVLPDFRLTLLFGLALGTTAGTSFVLGYTLLQLHTSDETRGRTFAAFYTGTRIALFSALGLAPFVAGSIGTPILIVGGVVWSMSGIRLTILLGGLVGFVSALQGGRGMYRALRDHEDRPVRLPARSLPAVATAGVFVAFEGGEGAGKSTQVRRLADALRDEGRDVVVTREPGGPPVAERIRRLLLDPNAEDMHARTEVLLYAAARAEHVERVILPALEAGKVVVCDRYVDSSLAYQGYGRELGADVVFEINRWATAAVLPDVVVLLDLDPEEGLRRVAERGRRQSRRPGPVPLPADPFSSWAEQGGTDRLEREDVDFHRRVVAGFRELARKDRPRFLVVDASGDAGSVARQVRTGLHPWLPLPESDAARGRESAGGEDGDSAAAAGGPG